MKDLIDGLIRLLTWHGGIPVFLVAVVLAFIGIVAARLGAHP